MAVITRQQLLAAGTNYGHNTRRWNPKMAEYIFEKRNGVHIIDIAKTEELVEIAYAELRNIVSEGGRVIFVGTRRNSQGIIKQEAERCGQFYVDQRWLGGTLTNFKTIRRGIFRLEEIEALEESGDIALYTKKEQAQIAKEKAKLEKFFTGIREMKAPPQAMVVVDPASEEIAVREARKLHIPVFGLVDTNCDPDMVDFVIPGNDDDSRSVYLIVATLANAVAEANGEAPLEIVIEERKEEDRPRRGRRRSEGKPRERHVQRQKEVEVVNVEQDEAAEAAPAKPAKKAVKAAPAKKAAQAAPAEKAPTTRKIIKLEHLELNGRITKALEAAELTTAKKISYLTESKLREVPGIGPKAVEDIKAALKTVDLELKEE